jgi:hypothetical protein
VGVEEDASRLSLVVVVAFDTSMDPESDGSIRTFSIPTARVTSGALTLTYLQLSMSPAIPALSKFWSPGEITLSTRLQSVAARRTEFDSDWDPSVTGSTVSLISFGSAVDQRALYSGGLLLYC